MKKLVLVLAVLTLGLCAGLRAAEKKEESSIMDKKFSIGMELGLPMLVGLNVAYEILPRFSLGAGGTAMGTFSAINLKGRFNLKPDNFRPYLAAGYTMYNFSGAAGTNDNLALSMMNASFGIEYAWNSGFAIGAEIVYNKALSAQLTIADHSSSSFSFDAAYSAVLPNLQIRAYF
jgi:hypothetical protein